MCKNPKKEKEKEKEKRKNINSAQNNPSLSLPEYLSYHKSLLHLKPALRVSEKNAKPLHSLKSF